VAFALIVILTLFHKGIVNGDGLLFHGFAAAFLARIVANAQRFARHICVVAANKI
jgi:hypothetical protein